MVVSIDAASKCGRRVYYSTLAQLDAAVSREVSMAAVNRPPFRAVYVRRLHLLVELSSDTACLQVDRSPEPRHHARDANGRVVTSRPANE